MIKGISCVEIPVSNMEEAVIFYENILGLRKSYEHPVWTAFDVGGTIIGLAASGTKKMKEGAKICKTCSVCVLRYAKISNAVLYLKVEDIDEAYGKLKEQGVKFLTKPQEQKWSERTATMLDPDDNVIVLTERQTKRLSQQT